MSIDTLYTVLTLVAAVSFYVGFFFRSRLVYDEGNTSAVTAGMMFYLIALGAVSTAVFMELLV